LNRSTVTVIISVFEQGLVIELDAVPSGAKANGRPGSGWQQAVAPTRGLELGNELLTAVVTI
jgi:hypothetical protein